MNVSVVYVTNRYHPRFDWVKDSLLNQLQQKDQVQFLVVAPEHSNIGPEDGFKLLRPKPTIWSGPTRITKADWWSTSNARNTGICHATEPWVCFLDDRSALLPGWADCLRQAIAENYMVCGAYEKVHNLQVVGGKITGYQSIGAVDSRVDYVNKYWKPHFKTEGPFRCPGEWTYGCCLALPTEWALEVGGFEELCDGSSGEDYIFGLMLSNCGKLIKYDPRMKMFEDRTPGLTDPVAIRKDKGVSPNDKSHALLAKLRQRKSVIYPRHLRSIRDAVLRGEPYPECELPHTDWFDGQPIKDME